MHWHRKEVNWSGLGSVSFERMWCMKFCTSFLLECSVDAHQQEISNSMNHVTTCCDWVRPSGLALIMNNLNSSGSRPSFLFLFKLRIYSLYLKSMTVEKKKPLREKTLPTCRKAKSWSANGVTRPRIAAHWLGDFVASWLGISRRSVILFAKKNNLAIYNTYVPMLQSCWLSLKATYINLHTSNLISSHEKSRVINMCISLT